MKWGDEKFLDLSDKAMLLFDLLLTCPQQTSLGAMRASVDSLASEFLSYPGIQRSRWSRFTFRKAFCEISDKEMVFADEKAAVIWLPNFLKHNRPANPKVVKSWPTVLESLPECETRTLIIKHILCYTKELGEAYVQAFQEAFRESFGNGYPNSPETVWETVSKQLPKQFPTQEQEHGSPSSPPTKLSDIIKENTPALLNRFSWDWWKPRLEEVQIRVWGAIGLQEEELHNLIDGVDGDSGFRTAGALCLAIEQTKTRPNYPYRYLKKKAEDQGTVARLIKKAESMNNEDFEKGTSQERSLTGGGDKR